MLFLKQSTFTAFVVASSLFTPIHALTRSEAKAAMLATCPIPEGMNTAVTRLKGSVSDCNAHYKLFEKRDTRPRRGARVATMYLDCDGALASIDCELCNVDDPSTCEEGFLCSADDGLPICKSCDDEVDCPAAAAIVVLSCTAGSCGPGQFCSQQVDGTSLCREYQPVGGTCEGDSLPQEELCDPSKTICAKQSPYSTSGTCEVPCQFNSDCAAGHQCLGLTFDEKEYCIPYQGIGENCNGFGMLFCDPSSAECVTAPLPELDPNQPSIGDYGLEGTCEPIPCEDNTSCDDKYYCGGIDLTAYGTNHCRPFQTIGAPCDAATDLQCNPNEAVCSGSGTCQALVL